MTGPAPQYTDFSKDVLGRYVCNGQDEALASTTCTNACPFDLIIVGGGSFGAALAQHLLGPTTVDPDVPRAEVWGLPWRTNIDQGFPGLAYCTGGRSLFWGGWSPQLLEQETPADLRPPSVLSDLRGSGTFTGPSAEAANQIGVTQTNDFVFGVMHRAMHKQLFDGLQAGTVVDAIPLADLPPVVGNKRAMVALGHDILLAAWFILTRDVDYHDLVSDYFDTHTLDPGRKVTRLAKQLQTLGYPVTLERAP